MNVVVKGIPTIEREIYIYIYTFHVFGEVLVMPKRERRHRCFYNASRADSGCVHNESERGQEYRETDSG